MATAQERLIILQETAVILLNFQLCFCMYEYISVCVRVRGAWDVVSLIG